MSWIALPQLTSRYGDGNYNKNMFFSISSKQNAEYLQGKVIEVPSHLREVGLEINVYCFHRIVFLQRHLRRGALPMTQGMLSQQLRSFGHQSLSAPPSNLFLPPLNPSLSHPPISLCPLHLPSSLTGSIVPM